jgi:uncharacterized tellurite resistance protein B-like protein
MLFNRKSELNVLINLAIIDHLMDAKEANLIRMIGKANQIPEAEVEDLIAHPQTITNIRQMTEDEKFEHLYFLITLMKADGRILKEEISFCEKIANRLGYESGVIGALSQHIYSTADIQSDRTLLRAKMDRYRIR